MARHPESPWQLHLDFSDRSAQPPEVAYPVGSGSLVEVDQRELELGRFVRRINPGGSTRTPAQAAAFFLEHIYTPWESFTQEEMYTVLLDNLNRPTHTAMIYRGTLNTIYIRAAEIFRPAIVHNAAYILLAHNHPSGAVEPSPEDIRTTHLLVEAGRLLDIEVVDHLIIGDQAFLSMRERALLEG